VRSPQFFDEERVRARLRMADLIEAMERALVEFSAGRVEQPVRTVIRVRSGTLAFRIDAVVRALASGAGSETGDGVRREQRPRAGNPPGNDRDARPGNGSGTGDP
jgi:ornithine cyclodeaminase/alanine dehydrogenase-like protein (mu-crystallin family)